MAFFNFFMHGFNKQFDIYRIFYLRLFLNLRFYVKTLLSLTRIINLQRGIFNFLYFYPKLSVINFLLVVKDDSRSVTMKLLAKAIEDQPSITWCKGYVRVANNLWLPEDTVVLGSGFFCVAVVLGLIKGAVYYQFTTPVVTDWYFFGSIFGIFLIAVWWANVVLFREQIISLRSSHEYTRKLFKDVIDMVKNNHHLNETIFPEKNIGEYNVVIMKHKLYIGAINSNYVSVKTKSYWDSLETWGYNKCFFIAFALLLFFVVVKIFLAFVDNAITPPGVLKFQAVHKRFFCAHSPRKKLVISLKKFFLKYFFNKTWLLKKLYRK